MTSSSGGWWVGNSDSPCSRTGRRQQVLVLGLRPTQTELLLHSARSGSEPGLPVSEAPASASNTNTTGSPSFSPNQTPLFRASTNSRWQNGAAGPGEGQSKGSQHNSEDSGTRDSRSTSYASIVLAFSTVLGLTCNPRCRAAFSGSRSPGGCARRSACGSKPSRTPSL